MAQKAWDTLDKQIRTWTKGERENFAYEHDKWKVEKNGKEPVWDQSEYQNHPVRMTIAMVDALRSLTRPEPKRDPTTIDTTQFMIQMIVLGVTVCVVVLILLK